VVDVLSPVAVTAVLLVEVGDCSACFVDDVRVGTASSEFRFGEAGAVMDDRAEGGTSVPAVEVDGGALGVDGEDEVSSTEEGGAIGCIEDVRMGGVGGVSGDDSDVRGFSESIDSIVSTSTLHPLRLQSSGNPITDKKNTKIVMEEGKGDKEGGERRGVIELRTRYTRRLSLV
jgi:hypothetical protein